MPTPPDAAAADMSECFPIVWDIADRPEWSVRLVGQHRAWQAPGPRGCCSSLLVPSDLVTVAEPHHLLWLETNWAARLPYITPASCGGGSFRWPGPAASRVRPTRTVIGFWGWDGREARPALGPLAVTETGAFYAPVLRTFFSQHPEYHAPPPCDSPLARRLLQACARAHAYAHAICAGRAHVRSMA